MFLFKKKVKPIEKKEERLYEMTEEQLRATYWQIIESRYCADVAHSELMAIKDRVRLAEADGKDIDPYVKSCLDRAIEYAKRSMDISDYVIDKLLPTLRG